MMVINKLFKFKNFTINSRMYKPDYVYKTNKRYGFPQQLYNVTWNVY